jgi:uncharacterized protein YjbI with pentapeptide repeats
MAKTMRSRVAWVLAAILAVAVVGGVGLLGVRLRPYWVAMYRGDGADLHGTSLPFAPLEGVSLNSANLIKADLFRANLHGSDLTGADLAGTDLSYANRTGALLTCADLRGADLRGADLRGADLGVGDLLVHRTNLRGIRYDQATRWPAGVDPDDWCPGWCH